MSYFRQLLPAVLVLVCAPPVLPQTAEHSLEWGFEQRVRNENWDNIMDFNDGTADVRNQIRYRTRLWMNLPVTDSIDVYAGLNQETNQIIRARTPWKVDEGIIENAYIDFKRLFVKGLSLRVGRQNLIRGEGFLMLEGNPYDGSRSIYFNAVDLAYSWKKSKLELIGISDPAYDRYFPQINDRHRSLIEWNEQALGAYYTNKDSAKTSIESYYFYKKEFHDYRAPSNPQFQPDRYIHTAGGRVVRTLAKNLSLTGEFAFQWGNQHPHTAIRGWGGYSYVKKQFAGDKKPYVLGGYWGMSGDDPKTTNRIEAWDPLFSRWPKFSELYIYTQLKETGVAYNTNLGMWQGEVGFSPAKPLQFRGTYYHMNAYHPFAGSPKIFSTGLTRGDLYETRLDFKLNKSWSGHVLWEHLLPGNFYAGETPGYFLRFEMIYLLKGTVRL
jgi:hypothetical protein